MKATLIGVALAMSLSVVDSLYNCFKVDDIQTRSGFTKLGVENVGMLMTRGVLIGVAALKGVDMLPDAYEITVQDLQQALQRQNITLQPGKLVGADNWPVEVAPAAIR